MNINKKLQEFLRDNDIYNKFVREANLQGIDGDINDIMDGFLWEGTEDGFSYWSEVSDRYDKEM